MTTNFDTCGCLRRGPVVAAALAAAALAVPGLAHAANGNGNGNGNGNANAGGNNPNAGGANAGGNGNGNGNGNANAGGNNPNAGGANAGGNGNNGGGNGNAHGNNPNAGGANAGGGNNPNTGGNGGGTSNAGGNGNGSGNAGGGNPNAGGANAGGNGGGTSSAGGNGNGTGNAGGGNANAGGASAGGSGNGAASSSDPWSSNPSGDPSGSGSSAPSDTAGGDTSAPSNSNGGAWSATSDGGVAPTPPADVQPSSSDGGAGTPVYSPGPQPPHGTPASTAHQPQNAPVTSPTHVHVAQPAPTVADYGVMGAGAKLTLVRDPVEGRPVIRVALAHNGSNFSFDAVGDVLAVQVGLRYRIGAWLRTDTPGMTVCLRIKEISPKDPLTPVRTTETCMSPTTTWRHFRILRRTIARDDKLVFSIYSYNAVKGDNFEIKRFTVMRKTRDGWKRVDAAFGNKQPAT